MCRLLGLSGDPYEALLTLGGVSLAGLCCPSLPHRSTSKVTGLVRPQAGLSYHDARELMRAPSLSVTFTSAKAGPT